jgi:hypothetical protein
MEQNHLPKYDRSHNETGCCPRFDPASWEEQELHLKDRAFVRAKTLSLFHVPLNMGSVFASTFKAIKDANAEDEEFVVLSRDISPWTSEHLFSVTREVPGADNVKLSGDFVTHVFEGPYSETGKWCEEMERFAAAKGKRIERQFYFYTTCPKCAKHYGKNYVVGVAQVSADTRMAAAA